MPINDPRLDVSVRAHRANAGKEEGGEDGKGFRLWVSAVNHSDEMSRERLTLDSIVLSILIYED